jgi:hypothetical protein
VAFPHYVSTILRKSNEIGYDLPRHQSYLLNSFNTIQLLPAETVLYNIVSLNSDHTTKFFWLLKQSKKQFTAIENQGYEKDVPHGIVLVKHNFVFNVYYLPTYA